MFLPNIHTMSGSRPPTTEKQTKKETKVQPQYGLTTNLALQGEERKEGGFTRDLGGAILLLQQWPQFFFLLWAIELNKLKITCNDLFLRKFLIEFSDI